MIFKITEKTGKSCHCECCGHYCAHGTHISVNEVEVWSEFSDGHMYSNKTEKPLQDLVLAEWNRQCINAINEQHTEEARIQWNEDYPTSTIALEVESWESSKNNQLLMQKNSYQQVIERCKNLPSDIQIAVKMIALWIENETGYIINIKETSEQY